MNNKTDIEFEQLRYSAKRTFFSKTEKHILKNVNGEFRSCELSAIIGPSGSGKSTLLNILSGFVNKNVYGAIRINGQDRVDDSFKKQSTYIMQEENLHSLLTVNEAMTFAVKLKTGNELTKPQRQIKIIAILKTLGLDGKLNDFSGDLSGGEQKRLSIALELVDDPTILFLDEPTTGLDSSSSTQCIKLLKKLAQQGKTIVCTIHTPSALLFEMFDHLYALADGYCIYQGASCNLVPFLKELDLVCPEVYNPADFLLEIATNEYGIQNSRLVQKAKNGLNEQFRNLSNNNNNNNEDDLDLINDHKTASLGTRQDYSSSFIAQFILLLYRNLLFSKRDKMLAMIRLLVHLIVGLMIGFLYFGIGNEAKQIFNIFRFVAIAVGFLAYSGFYSIMVRCPLELPVTKREHFNRWYSTSAYYLALIISDIPVIVTCATVYTFLIYGMTNQPLEAFRFINFLLIGIMTSFVAQSFGLLMGSMFDVKLCLSMAALLMAVQILFSGFFIVTQDVDPYFKWLFDMTYLKHSLDGVGALIFGYNRTKLDCSEFYCHFQTTQKFMNFIGLKEDLPTVFFALTSTLIIVHITTFLIMRYRLKN